MNYLLMCIDEIENFSSQLIFEGQRCTHSYSSDEWVLKPCHENNGAAIYVGRAATLHYPLF